MESTGMMGVRNLLLRYLLNPTNWTRSLSLSLSLSGTWAIMNLALAERERHNKSQIMDIFIKLRSARLLLLLFNCNIEWEINSQPSFRSVCRYLHQFPSTFHRLPPIATSEVLSVVSSRPYLHFSFRLGLRNSIQDQRLLTISLIFSRWRPTSKK
ncbi:hypothetical protein K1719_003608 [Acacia pycnantha]|nr:hypothetical protein K1719_003608 [Acacia pycnantha]